MLVLMSKGPEYQPALREPGQPAHQTGAMELKCLKLHILYGDSGRASYIPVNTGVSSIVFLKFCAFSFTFSCYPTLYASSICASLSPESCNVLPNYAVNQVSTAYFLQE